jgi:hypothetical protein
LTDSGIWKMLNQSEQVIIKLAGESDYYPGGYMGMGHSASLRVPFLFRNCPLAQTVASPLWGDGRGALSLTCLLTWAPSNRTRQMTKAQRDIRRKLRVLQYAADIGNIAKACRYFGISRETSYVWQRALAAHGEAGLVNKKPCPENPTLRTPQAIEEKIIYLRRTYHLGQLRISWYLARYY